MRIVLCHTISLRNRGSDVAGDIVRAAVAETIHVSLVSIGAFSRHLNRSLRLSRRSPIPENLAPSLCLSYCPLNSMTPVFQILLLNCVEHVERNNCHDLDLMRDLDVATSVVLLCSSSATFHMAVNYLLCGTQAYCLTYSLFLV